MLMATDPNVAIQAVRALAHRIREHGQLDSLPISVDDTTHDSRWQFAAVQAIHTANQTKRLTDMAEQRT
jgi:hypothetical protein